MRKFLALFTILILSGFGFNALAKKNIRVIGSCKADTVIIEINRGAVSRNFEKTFNQYILTKDGDLLEHIIYPKGSIITIKFKKVKGKVSVKEMEYLRTPKCETNNRICARGGPHSPAEHDIIKGLALGSLQDYEKYKMKERAKAECREKTKMKIRVR
ncbi:hypothetical protein ACFL29_02115 [Patescibacteria group bacterium]